MAWVQDPATGQWYDDAQTSAPVDPAGPGGYNPATDYTPGGAVFQPPTQYGGAPDPEADPNAYDPYRNPGGTYTGAPNPYQPGPSGAGPTPTAPPDPTIPPPTTPPPGGGGGTGGTGGGGGGTSGGGGGDPLAQPSTNFTPPAWLSLPSVPGVPDAPTPNLPTFHTPAPFKFTAPSINDALTDPGYQFRLSEGERALQGAAAARGTLNDSGTLKSMLDYGGNSASQEYQNVWNRDWTAQTGEYNTNYQTQTVDPYKFEYQHALDLNAPKIQQWQAGVDMSRLGYGTQAADVMARNGMQNTDALQKYLSTLDLFKFNANLASGA